MMPAPHATPSVTDVPPKATTWVTLLGLWAIIFLASLLGILTRPEGFFSAFWPANPLLLGLMLRYPPFSRASVWLAAFLGYVMADLLTGSSLLAAVWLNATNVIGVGAGWLILRRLDKRGLQFRRQSSALIVFIASCAAAMTGAMLGGPAGPVLFRSPYLTTTVLWFAGELMNFMLLLPVILTVPSRWNLRRTDTDKPRTWLFYMPAVSVFLTELAAYLVGGPGAITFTVPALLWCALTYRPFPTTVLTLMVCMIHTAAISSGVYFFVPDKVHEVFSLRVGITLLSLGPLAVVCSRAAGAEVLKRLHQAVNYDSLTQALARAALIQQSEQVLERLRMQQASAAVLMLDIDHFKSFNDQYGHATGDLLLSAFAKTIAEALRPQDLFGRVGGEEFAILLPQVADDEALAVAQRLCEAVRHGAFTSACGKPLSLTVSVGLKHCRELQAEHSLSVLLRDADLALYRAKQEGRNRVTVI